MIKMHMPKLASVRGQTLLTDNKPYLFRQSPVVAEMLDDMLTGGTVAWNQLVNGAGTVTVTNNHKYVSHIGSTWSIAISNGSAISVGASDLVTDLTQMFGSTIADYVYSLEQQTAGSGIAWLKSFGFFTADYYPYDAGSLLSVKTSGHKTVGKNLLDDSDRVLAGANILFGGATTPNDGVSAVLPAGTYTYSVVTADGTSTHLYAKNANTNTNLSGFPAYSSLAKTFTLTEETPIRAWVYKAGYTSVDDIETAQIEYGNRATDYEPYTAHTYPLSDIELRGSPKLTDGQMYYDGDSYESDGTVTRKYGIRAYQAGDESLADAVTDGTNTVYKLVAPTTETTDSFTNPQQAGSTEEYIDERTVPMPVGHSTEYFNMVQKEQIQMHMPTHSPIKMHMEG